MELSNLFPFLILTIAAVSHTNADDLSNISSAEEVTYYPRSCAETIVRRTGVHVIHPQPGFSEPFRVYCDHDYDGGGWSVIQNRFDGSVFFFRGWEDYENGFGNLNGEHWLGLRKIFEMTSSQYYELVIVMADRAGFTVHIKYDHFLVANPESKYRLTLLGNYSGNAGDSLSYHLNQKFSTFDSDNDESHENCAEKHMAGYWYKSCYTDNSNLNGLYWKVYTGYPSSSWMVWYTFRKHEVLGLSRMMIRPVIQKYRE